MQLIGLVETPDHVCCRYRLRAFRDRLAAAGHSLDIRRMPRHVWDSVQTFSGLGRYDAVILQRRLISPWRLHILRRLSKRLIFDFDDAVFMRDSYSAKGANSPRRRRRFAMIVRGADVVVAGNDWLAERARAVGARGEVRVIPTCVDPSRYPRAKHAHGPARLVWVGSSSTLNGLERIAGMLDSIGTGVPGVRLRLIANRFPEFGRLKVEPRPWSEATEADEIAAADIGIAWIPDDDWSRGKCGLKVLQYMAAGLPVVANPVGLHAALVRHGETGFLARTDDEWLTAIRRLADDPALRRKMGTAGRWVVEREYSADAGARRWLDLLRSMASSRRIAS
jgi:glycosyltransferase involved in cell wall biosynthesis